MVCHSMVLHHALVLEGGECMQQVVLEADKMDRVQRELELALRSAGWELEFVIGSQLLYKRRIWDS